MPYFDRPDNLKIFYTLHGEPSNPPFLLIHGLTCDSTDWIFTIPALTHKYRVIAFDLRGHGHSSAPENITYTIEDFTDDAVALLEHLNFNKNVLVMGHSMGGIVASAATAIHPKIFRGLVLIDPLYWRTKTFWAITLPRWDERQSSFTFMNMAFGNLLVPGNPILPWSSPQWMCAWHTIRDQTTARHVVTKTLQGAFAADMLGQQEAHTELVKDRTIPRLAVYMAEDNVAKEMKLGVGKSIVLHYPYAGHWMHQINPEVFNPTLTTWLENAGLT